MGFEEAKSRRPCPDQPMKPLEPDPSRLILHRDVEQQRHSLRRA